MFDENEQEPHEAIFTVTVDSFEGLLEEIPEFKQWEIDIDSTALNAWETGTVLKFLFSLYSLLQTLKNKVFTLNSLLLPVPNTYSWGLFWLHRDRKICEIPQQACVDHSFVQLSLNISALSLFLFDWE